MHEHSNLGLPNLKKAEVGVTIMHDIFFDAFVLARYFFKGGSACSIFFGGFNPRPHQISNGPPLSGFGSSVSKAVLA